MHFLQDQEARPHGAGQPRGTSGYRGPAAPVSGAPLGPGERVLLIDPRARRYLITLTESGRWHSHLGILDHDELIGGPEGVTATTTGGSKLVVFRPALADYVLKMQRGAQVVYPKDAALMVSLADIYPGATVLEAGAGSGALSLILARAVGGSGRVVSYELRQDHLERAAKNIDVWQTAASDAAGKVDLRLGDVFQEALEPADRMVFDLPEPWRAVGTALDALVAGGIVCCYLPTVPQVVQTVEALRAGGFGLLSTVEALVRTWNIEGQSVRPDHRMVGHTGFIVTGRKLSP